MSDFGDLAALRAHFLRMKGEAEAGLAKCDAISPPPPAVSAATVDPIYMTLDEYADRRRVSMSTLRKWIALGLPHRRVGRVIRVLVKDADAWEARAAIRRTVDVGCATGRNH